MTKELLLTLVLAFFVLLVGLMAVGWYTRRRRQRNVPPLHPVPADPGGVIAQFTGFYVSTTPEGEPLNRVAVRGLGFRAKASITVTEGGVIVSLPATDFFIPASALREATRARYTIDRIVEEGGLVLIAWTLDGGDAVDAIPLDSYFRVAETQEMVDAVGGLIHDGSIPNERKKA